ncbi:MAG: lipoprotein signal peptidase [Bacteroidales bacterium]
MEKRHIPWVIIPGILLIDQVSKILVKLNMTLGQSIPVFGDWFQIYFTENYGMAFGLEFSGEYGKLFLSILRIVAVIAIGWYIYHLVRKKASSGLIACISLIMAGAIGNIIDSSFYGLIFSESHFNQVAEWFPDEGGYGTFLHGQVVDLFYFPIIRGTIPEWIPYRGGEPFIFFRPVFNVADSAITIGVLIMIIFQKKFFVHEREESSPDEETPERQ